MHMKGSMPAGTSSSVHMLAHTCSHACIHARQYLSRPSWETQPSWITTLQSPRESKEKQERKPLDRQAGRRAADAVAAGTEVQGALGGRRGRGGSDFLAWDDCWAWACMITETGWDNEVSVGTQEPLKQIPDPSPPCNGIRL